MKIARIENIVGSCVQYKLQKSDKSSIPEIGFFFFGSAAPIGKNFLHFLFF